MKKTLLAVLAVFVAWSVMGFIVHGLILRPSYEATAHLWRPMGEMKMGLMYFTILVASLVFVSIYTRFFGTRGQGTGVKYGLWYGLGVGISLGYGTYSVMPIPYHMALVWFLGSLAEGFVGGLVVGSLLRE